MTLVAPLSRNDISLEGPGCRAKCRIARLIAEGNDPVTEGCNRLHDFPVGRSSRVGVAKAQQKIIGSRSLAPTPKLPCALLGVAQNQPVPGNCVQGELGFRLDALKLGQAVAPVVFIRGQDLGAVNQLGLGPGIPY